MVLFQTSNGKWRMCTDFTDLNKACPKDAYPLRNIDMLLDGVSSCELLSFMHAYSIYNQIRMHPKDIDKTTFRGSLSNFCYTVMPFGLKNMGSMYQRLMDRIFEGMIGRNVEAYVDDMVVNNHVQDLRKLFQTLDRYKLKLNPKKCVFSVKAEKFLGFMLTQREIEMNPKKCEAILSMRSPVSIKEVQQLAGRMTSLSRFIPTASERSVSFFRCLLGNDRFTWTEESEEAFRKLKDILASPPILIKPTAGLHVYLYLCVTKKAISTMLTQEKEKEHRSINFVSQTLRGKK